MNKEVKDLLNKCDNCKLKECIACEFTYTDIQKIKKYVEETESILDKVTEECRKQMKEYEDSILEIFPGNLLNIIEGEKNAERTKRL